MFNIFKGSENYFLILSDIIKDLKCKTDKRVVVLINEKKPVDILISFIEQKLVKILFLIICKLIIINC